MVFWQNASVFINVADIVLIHETMGLVFLHSSYIVLHLIKVASGTDYILNLREMTTQENPENKSKYSFLSFKSLELWA